MTDNKELKSLGEYLKSLVSDEIKAKGFELKEAEAQKIVKAIIPEMDLLISKRVKQHFLILLNAMKDKIIDKSEEK